MELLHIRSCSSTQDKELSEYFESAIGSLDIYNVFNPSFYCDENVKIFTFRAILKGSKELSSFISIEDQEGHSIKNISTDFRKELGTIRLIDPKIAQINGDFYITFNSGWMPKGNDIFIMKIYPEMEPPKRILYKNRKKQERNWAFFSEQGEIYALYWLNPLKILKVGRMNPKTWEMEEYYSEKEKNNESPKDLTIGTQLSKLNNKYYFVGHKKIYLWRKKIYFGKLCMLDFAQKRIHPEKNWIIHSWKSLLGAKIKHNTNLFSCTYFSGLQASKDCIRLGYGINDVGFGFSKHKIGQLSNIGSINEMPQCVKNFMHIQKGLKEKIQKRITLLGSLLQAKIHREGSSGVFQTVLHKTAELTKFLYVAAKVTHVFGPKNIPYKQHEAIVLCLVKDGEEWIQDFIEHYLRKGFKHIVFLDNGSTDGTLHIAKKYATVTILETKIPFKHNNAFLRRYLITRFSKKRWSLTVDIDELWDYPYSDKFSLEKLLKYLSAQGANAVIAQMLDMFMPYLPTEKVPLSAYDYYDISHIKKDNLMTKWFLDARVFLSEKELNSKMGFLKGGIRAQLFGLKNIWLTKIPLLFFDKTLHPLVDPHGSDNAIIADISSVLFHYKFTSHFKDQVQDALKGEQYSNNSGEYKAYAQRLQGDSPVQFQLSTAKRFKSVNQLIDEKFLVVSDLYLNEVDKIIKKH